MCTGGGNSLILIKLYIYVQAFYMVRLPSKKKKKKKKNPYPSTHFFSGMLPETFFFFSPNPYLTNGLSHHYHLGVSTFILRDIRSDFEFLFKFLKANRIASDGMLRSATLFAYVPQKANSLIRVKHYLFCFNTESSWNLF